MVLADDITGNGKLDLVVTTQHGNVYLLGTEAPYHPLNTWTSQNQGRNGFTAKVDQGVYVDLHSREHLIDVFGSSFKIAFEIVDLRVGSKNERYNVKVRVTLCSLTYADLLWTKCVVHWNVPYTWSVY
jgi:hypothetical protein